MTNGEKLFSNGEGGRSMGRVLAFLVVLVGLGIGIGSVFVTKDMTAMVLGLVGTGLGGKVLSKFAEKPTKK
tara:strand:+ start:3805 stop:4017 length:213 start_codon:yes stop_codon:yes gene_type:complete